MQTQFLWLAAAAGVMTFGVHTFIGGVYVARPLLTDRTLPKASKWLNYYCWHVATISLVVMSGCFAYAAVHPDSLELAYLATGLSLAFSVLSASVALRGRIHPLRFPSTSLLALMAVLGWFGLA